MAPEGVYAEEEPPYQGEPEPEPYVQAPPAIAAPVAINLPDDDLDPLPLRPSGIYNSEQNRSGLLVVLEDDEDDDIPSDRIDKQTASIKRGSGSHVRAASFDEPITGAVKKPGQVDLPDLPELPGR